MLENTIMKKIIGKKAEIKQVLECFESDKSELVSVYGRHRVGKRHSLSNDALMKSLTFGLQVFIRPPEYSI